MNKKLITLAVAAAMVAPLAASAETTLYGRLETALVNYDTDEDNGDDVWDVDTGTTRIGVKGSEDLGNGLKALFQAEWQFSSDKTDIVSDPGGPSVGGSTDPGRFDNRVAWVGLSGGFGTVSAGRQWTPYYGAVAKTNIFNDPAGNGSGSSNPIGAHKYYLGPTRSGNSIAYASPNFNGFQIRNMLILSEDLSEAAGGDGANGIDAYNPSVTYENGPIKVGLSLLDFDSDLDQQDRWGIGASYSFGMFRIVGMYEDMDETDGSSLDNGVDSWSLGGEYDFGNNTVRAIYGQKDPDTKGDTAASAELDVWALGIQHNFSKRTRVYAEYVANDRDYETAKDQDMDSFSIGLRHDF